MPGEILPGQPSPLVQVPEETQQPLTLPLGLENPETFLPPPLPGLPAADLSAQIQRPQRLLQGENPSGAAGLAGGDMGFNIGQGSIAHPLELPAGAQPNQGNMVPLVAFPVLSRGGPEFTSWAAAVAIAGQPVVNVRGTYRDLRITPGFRGLQIQYGAAAGAVSIRENTTGMIYTLPTGPQTIFLPLFMLREVFDLTITGPGGTAFPAGSTALLTTEEQLPFIMA